MKRRTFFTVAILAAWIGVSHANEFPSRPVRLIVPFAPGGSTDAVARIISEPLAKHLGQPVVIENKGGAGGIIGTTEVIRSSPDGHTLLFVSPSITAAVPAINPNAGYNPVSDLTAITNVAAGPTILAVHPSFPARNWQDFIAELKKNPDKYSYASPGVGGIINLQMEAFKSLTGTSIKHIPFKGAGPGLTAVLGGQVQIIQDSMPSAYPYVRDGRLVALAVTAPERRKEMPNVPTFAEVGLPSLNYMGHFGIVGPKALPKDVIDKINTAVRKTVEDPAVRKRLEDSGVVVIANSPQEFSTEIKQVYEQARKVVVERKLTAE